MNNGERKMRLKAIRARHGLTQKDVADALKAMGRDASQAYISEIESGEKDLGLRLTLDLKKAYKARTFNEIVEALTGLNPDHDEIDSNNGQSQGDKHES
jgi:transcriptional regulator with XRE-family HTH domain